MGNCLSTCTRSESSADTNNVFDGLVEQLEEKAAYQGPPPNLVEVSLRIQDEGQAKVRDIVREELAALQDQIMNSQKSSRDEGSNLSHRNQSTAATQTQDPHQRSLVNVSSTSYCIWHPLTISCPAIVTTVDIAVQTNLEEEEEAIKQDSVPEDFLPPILSPQEDKNGINSSKLGKGKGIGSSYEFSGTIDLDIYRSCRKLSVLPEEELTFEDVPPSPNVPHIPHQTHSLESYLLPHKDTGCVIRQLSDPTSSYQSRSKSTRRPLQVQKALQEDETGLKIQDIHTQAHDVPTIFRFPEISRSTETSDSESGRYLDDRKLRDDSALSGSSLDSHDDTKHLKSMDSTIDSGIYFQESYNGSPRLTSPTLNILQNTASQLITLSSCDQPKDPMFLCQSLSIPLSVTSGSSPYRTPMDTTPRSSMFEFKQTESSSDTSSFQTPSSLTPRNSSPSLSNSKKSSSSTSYTYKTPNESPVLSTSNQDCLWDDISTVVTALINIPISNLYIKPLDFEEAVKLQRSVLSVLMGKNNFINLSDAHRDKKQFKITSNDEITSEITQLTSLACNEDMNSSTILEEQADFSHEEMRSNTTVLVQENLKIGGSGPCNVKCSLSQQNVCSLIDCVNHEHNTSNIHTGHQCTIGCETHTSIIKTDKRSLFSSEIETEFGSDIPATSKLFDKVEDEQCNRNINLNLVPKSFPNSAMTNETGFHDGMKSYSQIQSLSPYHSLSKSTTLPENTDPSSQSTTDSLKLSRNPSRRRLVRSLVRVTSQTAPPDTTLNDRSLPEYIKPSFPVPDFNTAILNRELDTVIIPDHVMTSSESNMGSPQMENERNIAVKPFPNLSDDDLKRLGLSTSPDSQLQHACSEQDIESKFLTLALAFRTDRLTLGSRFELQQRCRNQSERNMADELKKLKEDIQLLNPLCVDMEKSELFEKIQQQVDAMHKSTVRISSAAEMLGAVQQENRLSRAMDVILRHVEILKQRHDKERIEHEETRRLISESKAPILPMAPSSLKLSGKRRASIATLHRGQNSPAATESRSGRNRTGSLSRRLSSSTVQTQQQQKDTLAQHSDGKVDDFGPELEDISEQTELERRTSAASSTSDSQTQSNSHMDEVDIDEEEMEEEEEEPHSLQEMVQEDSILSANKSEFNSMNTVQERCVKPIFAWMRNLRWDQLALQARYVVAILLFVAALAVFSSAFFVPVPS